MTCLSWAVVLRRRSEQRWWSQRKNSISQQYMHYISPFSGVT